MFVCCMGEARCTSRGVCLRRGSSCTGHGSAVRRHPSRSSRGGRLSLAFISLAFSVDLHPPHCSTRRRCVWRGLLVSVRAALSAGRSRGLGRRRVILTWLVAMGVGSSDKRCLPEDESRSFKCLMSSCCFLLDCSQCFSYINIYRCFSSKYFVPFFSLLAF